MPPQHLTEVTNPNNQPEVPAPEPIDQRGVGRWLSALLGRANDPETPPAFTDLDMNVAETYAIRWDVDKCGRDAFQNFFDANGGTLDGVRAYMEELPSPPHIDDPAPTYAVTIEGDADYDFRELAVIGVTSKSIGEQTAGGFGEGAKFLALTLLKDHDADRVVYRSRDWQLEYFIGDLPEEKVVRPTRGLFARVATGLQHIEGSAMLVTSRNKETAEALLEARQFFRSSENPDFQDNVIEKTLPDGTQTGIKFMGVTGGKFTRHPNNGHLYVAGQRRHYGDTTDSWDTVRGISAWTTKDVAPGDRDRGTISKKVLKREIFAPLAESLTDEEVRTFFKGMEPVYTSELLTVTELDELAELIAAQGEKLGVKLEFEPKYVAAISHLDFTIKKVIEEAGYEICPKYFAKIGMRTSEELLKTLHEHQRLEPSPEQLARIELLQEGLRAMTEVEALKKQIKPKEIWLYSKELENNPFEGTYAGEFTWMSEEHLKKEFATVFAAYLHELDHEAGGDVSAAFSYALTDTLAEVIHAITGNPYLAHRFQHLTRRWRELGEESSVPDETA